MYPKWGSVAIALALVIIVIIALSSSKSSWSTLTLKEQARLEEFQHLQRGDILTDIIEGQTVPVMLVIESHLEEVKVDLGTKKSTTVKINVRVLSAGKMKIIKRGSADWCYLLEKFFAKQ